jgi:hypothetical protein
MIIDLIIVLKKREDPDPEEIISDPDPRGSKCHRSFGSGTLKNIKSKMRKVGKI